MPLEQIYPEDFLRCWRPYPKWPLGRSKKVLGLKAFLAAKKLLKFTDGDIDKIVRDIEDRAMSCLTWQHDYRSPRDQRPVGPPAFSVYFNQHLWNEIYEKKKTRLERWADKSDDRPNWKQAGFDSEESFRVSQARAFEQQRRKGFGLH